MAIEDRKTEGEARPAGTVERARRERGLLQAQLARLSNSSPALISIIERGYVPPRPRREAIAAALGVEASDLWGSNGGGAS